MNKIVEVLMPAITAPSSVLTVPIGPWDGPVASESANASNGVNSNIFPSLGVLGVDRPRRIDIGV